MSDSTWFLVGANVGIWMSYVVVVLGRRHQQRKAVERLVRFGYTPEHAVDIVKNGWS